MGNKAIKKSIDWNAIRAEYIGGGTSYRKLAEKYGVNHATIAERGKAESWTELREKAADKCLSKAMQKTADIAADNAVIAARIKQKLLAKIETEIDNLPSAMGSEARTTQTGQTVNKKGKPITETKSVVFKLRDLAAAYKDLTNDIVLGNDYEDLGVLAELLK